MAGPAVGRVVLRGGVLAALCGGAGALLAPRLQAIDWGAVGAALTRLPAETVLAVALLTALSYAAMAAYDGVALAAAGRRVPWRRSLAAGFAASAIGQTLGCAMLTGGAIRWRLYRPYGLGPGIAGLLSGALTLGFVAALAGVLAASLWWDGSGLAPLLGTSAGVLERVGALILSATVIAGVAIARVDRTRGRALFRLAALALVDILPAAAALWLLLPEGGGVGLLSFVPIYAAALALSLLSNAPFGIGVFELVCLSCLTGGDAQILAALIAFRGLYYFLPALLAGAVLIAIAGLGLRPENPQENRIDLGAVDIEVEKRRNLFGRQNRRHLRIAGERGQEIRPILPHRHGVALDQPIRLLPADPLLGQRQKHAL